MGPAALVSPQENAGYGLLACGTGTPSREDGHGCPESERESVSASLSLAAASGRRFRNPKIWIRSPRHREPQSTGYSDPGRGPVRIGRVISASPRQVAASDAVGFTVHSWRFGVGSGFRW